MNTKDIFGATLCTGFLFLPAWVIIHFIFVWFFSESSWATDTYYAYVFATWFIAASYKPNPKRLTIDDDDYRNDGPFDGYWSWEKWFNDNA